METSALKKFAQTARQDLLEQVSSKLAYVLKPESGARREYPAVVNELENAISLQGEEQLIDQVAYTWFNRFCALRFMDVNGLNRVGVVSPSEGQVQPEILAEAKSGVIDDTQINPRTVEQIRGLLSGSIPSPDSQSEAYRLLIVGSCNALYNRMPYLFERIQDFTELLMPDDLLSDNSILTKMRTVMTSESCQDVEIIGWLYQFYISEKKDEVFAGLKKNQKITAENIPAATQLFTPHWIVRYLVENSLGRLWMLNRPNSNLTEQMEYYIAPEEPETDFLKINSPEEIRLADPAAGSGHMLTYAFDLLYAIYEEDGYDTNDIPGLILKHNLYGIEIDDRAGALASFALEMKAAEKLGRRRFFKMDAKPNVCVLEDVTFSESEMDDVMTIVGKDLYTEDLRETLAQFERAKNFGSLIVPKLKDPAETARLIEAQDFSGDLLLSEVHERLVKVMLMAEFLAPKYHVVVANPPYLGGKGMNGHLSVFAKENFPDSKSDLFAMFMERTLVLSLKHGMIAMINMQSWMFLSSYENLRSNLLTHSTILSMAHLGERGFDTIGGAVVSTTAFVIQNTHHASLKGDYTRLVDGNSEAEKSAQMREAIQNQSCGWFYRSSAEDFGKIPGSPIAYWLSNMELQAFSKGKIEEKANVCIGMKTGDNEKFVRYWHEVSNREIAFYLESIDEANGSDCTWFQYLKGGNFRKWYGNYELILNWVDNGNNITNHVNSRGTSDARIRPSNYEYYFKSGVNWSFITSGSFGVRLHDHGFFFDVAGSALFTNSEITNEQLAGYLNSKVSGKFLSAINPTLNMQIENVKVLPAPYVIEQNDITLLVNKLKKISREDWNSYETSWDFINSPLLEPEFLEPTIGNTYQKFRAYWMDRIMEMRSLEEENNRIFINAYDLQQELVKDVPIEEITLNCNPAYRYGIKGTEEEREARLKADTMAEFLSYAVGCMFGRYSLDEPGLILASMGETLADYLARIPEPTFMPDDDNVIPMIDFEGDWFEDDISERFKQFLRVTFGEEHYAENLVFIEDALGKSVQKYFLKDFYKDHVQRYKKRPIYWLFSSPKGTFNALIYMHRYTPSTASVVLNEYLREFRTKLEARRSNYEQVSISSSSSQKEKTQALKMIDKLNKAIDEVNDYEREVLYPLAGENIAIDLDDGVKYNYPLFGKALKKVTGLS
ncbi:MAG: BREX-1 system adenine-specific DNA-methyltransferase PglX [bacterium]|nr:BREX-1 system adenine-specific DNA-methyltransferase PglX [bacterium]